MPQHAPHRQLRTPELNGYAIKKCPFEHRGIPCATRFGSCAAHRPLSFPKPELRRLQAVRPALHDQPLFLTAARRSQISRYSSRLRDLKRSQVRLASPLATARNFPCRCGILRSQTALTRVSGGNTGSTDRKAKERPHRDSVDDEERVAFHEHSETPQLMDASLHPDEPPWETRHLPSRRSPRPSHPDPALFQRGRIRSRLPCRSL